jgi:phosphoglycolate phosphatase
MRLFFDLDGTLIDPFPGITQSIQYALRELGYPVPPAESLRGCIGPPLRESLAQLMPGAAEEQLACGIEKYRARFRRVGIYENQLYPGIVEALRQLRQSGHSLSIATSKPTIFARQIIAHHGLDEFFQVIEGSELDGTRSDKRELLAHLLKRPHPAAGPVVMIGDRLYDMVAAKFNQVTGVGVLWGYGSREELTTAGASVLIETPPALPASLARAFPD